MKNYFMPVKRLNKWYILDLQSRTYYTVRGGKKEAVNRCFELNKNA
jgi:hypothetical protein